MRVYSIGDYSNVKNEFWVLLQFVLF